MRRLRPADRGGTCSPSRLVWSHTQTSAEDNPRSSRTDAKVGLLPPFVHQTRDRDHNIITTQPTASDDRHSCDSVFASLLVFRGQTFIPFVAFCSNPSGPVSAGRRPAPPQAPLVVPRQNEYQRVRDNALHRFQTARNRQRARRPLRIFAQTFVPFCSNPSGPVSGSRRPAPPQAPSVVRVRPLGLRFRQSCVPAFFLNSCPCSRPSATS